MRWSVDDYVGQMSFSKYHRPFFAELFGPLQGLPEEWREQGADEEELSLQAFGFDHVPVHRVSVNTGLQGGGHEVIEDTPVIRITRDAYGRHQKLIKASASIPLPMDFPIEGPEDWGSRFRHRYTWSDERMGLKWLENAKESRARGCHLLLGVPGAFDEVRQLMGDEEACVVCYEEPELLRDMLEVMGETICKAIRMISTEIRVDQISIHEDMAGKSGPMWGPQQMEDFAVPYYKKIRKEMDRFEIPLFEMDSDGDVTPILDHIVEGGINVLHPLEPTGNLDAVEVRERFGDRLAIKGGVNKFVIANGHRAIEEEIERVVLPLKGEMGVVFSLDHRIPPGTPLEGYRYYVRKMREALGLEEFEAGWGRMAF